MRQLNNQRGFTMVEVMLALTIATFMLIAILQFATGTITGFTTANRKATMLSEARLVVDSIGDDILLAAAADANNRVEDSNSPGAGLFGWASDSDTLILATAASDQSNNILFADPANYISHKDNVIYYLESGALYRRTLAADVPNNKKTTTCPPSNPQPGCPGDTKLIDSVQSFVATYYNSDDQEVSPENARSIGLALTLERKNYGKTTTVSYQTRTVFRND